MPYYKFIETGEKIYVKTGTCWRGYPVNIWFNKGELDKLTNVGIEPWVNPPPPEPTPEELMERAKSEAVNAVQMHLDSVASSRLYDGILSLCSYATSTDPVFAAEGQAGVVFRDGCWRKCYQIMEEVLAGTRTISTAEELIAELPTINW